MPPQGNQCPFCQLISNPDQLMTVGETDNFYAWLEVNPRAKGHTMVVPKEHVENVLDLSMEEWQEAFELTREVVEKAKQGLEADGASITVNIEEAGGQMLPHAYIQVFPRFEEDENAGTPTGAIFPQKEELQQKLDSIQQSMSGVQIDLGESKKTAHEESQKFKDESEIDSLLDKTDPRKDTAGKEEKPQKEPEKPEKKEEESQKAGADISDMSRAKLLQKLIEKCGGKKEFLESDELKRLLNEENLSLTERFDPSKEKKSYEWR